MRYAVVALALVACDAGRASKPPATASAPAAGTAPPATTPAPPAPAAAPPLGAASATPPPAVLAPIGGCRGPVDSLDHPAGDCAPTGGLGHDTGHDTAGLGIGGRGAGRPGGRAPAPPRLRWGPVTVSAGLARDVVRRVLRRNQAKFLYCYEREYVRRPALKGRIDATFTVDRTGTVSSTSAAGVDPAVATCVQTALRSMILPAPTVEVVGATALTFTPR